MKFFFELILGAIMCWTVYCLNGRPPNYSQDQMPVTSFSCRDKILGGYYADPETNCQMFHVCVKVPGLGVQDYKFLCPNDTAFDQENQICDDWYNIDCEAATLFYSDNFDLYRIGSDVGGEIIREASRLPNNNINNAVAEVDDDNYLQRSDRGESIGSDLLRGSHSSNFFANKHRGREEEDLKEELNKKKKAGNNKNQVRKLLTGKRPVPSSNNQVNYQDASQQPIQASQQPPRVSSAGRNRGTSNFQRPQQQQSPIVTEAPQQRQTETYNNQRPTYYQRPNFYTPTTPKAETVAPPRNDYFRNNNNYYSAVTQTSTQNYYSSPAQQNYNSPSTFAQTYSTAAPSQYTQNYQPTTRNYQSYSAATVSTETPVFAAYSASSVAPERVNAYETQKLYKLNTAAFQQTAQQDQYDDSKDDEFLKTAHSQNLGASNFNRVQNSLKQQWNATLSANYNFQQQPAATTKANTVNHQQIYNPTTLRPYYSASTTQKPFEQPLNSFYNPSTTQKSLVSKNAFVTPSTPAVHNSFFTPSTTQRPYQQTQNNYYTPVAANQKTTPQHQNAVNTAKVPNNNNYYQSATSAPQSASKNFQQRNFFPQQTSAPSAFQPNNYITTRTPQQVTTIRHRSRGGALYAHTTDATESPRPFTAGPPPPAALNAAAQTQAAAKPLNAKDNKEYDYAYYDDGAQAPEYDVDNVDFARTKSKTRT